MFDTLQSSIKNLGKKKFRSFLTIIGISIGVASVIIIGAISQCGSNALTQELESLGLGGLAVSAVPNSSAVLTDEDLKLVKQSSNVEQATPVMMQTTNVRVRDTDTSALVWGIDPSASEIVSIKILYGRMLNQQDISASQNVCLVDEEFAKKSYGRTNILGKKISILYNGAEETFTVVGMTQTGSGLLQNMMGSYIPTFVYIPYTTAQALTGKTNFDQIAVKVKESANVEDTGKSLSENLNNSNGIANGYLANDLTKQKENLTSMLNIITLVLSAVGAVSLLVASLSIMNVMLVSVHERTREIGIKKAVGATAKTIMLEFLFEACGLSLLGCFAGFIIGGSISWIASLVLSVSIQPRGDVMALTAAFSMISGIVFGVYPAYKASCLKPVDALRTE